MLSVPSLLIATALLVGAVGKCPCLDTSKAKASCVWHGRPTDPFWQGVKKAAERAAADVGVDLSVRLFEKFDEGAMVAAVEEEADKKPAFMVVSLAGQKVADEVKKLELPVFAVNAGFRLATDAKVMNFIGQDGRNAGRKVGEKLVKALPEMKKGFFINAEHGNVAMDARSTGMKSALEEAGLGFEEVVVPADDEEACMSILKEKLAGDDPFGVAIGANSAVKAVLDRLKAVEAKTASVAFDLGASVFAAIKAGELAAAVDQQPWLQGYLPVVLGALQMRTGQHIPQPVLNTGPVLVTEPPSPTHAACIAGDKCADPKELTVSVVLHAIKGSQFWDRVQLGAEAAARDLGVQLSFERPPSVKTVVSYLKKKLKERSGSSSALVVSPALPSLEPAVKEAAAKLPTIGANAGGPECPSLGCLAFVGQNETSAGEQAGASLVSQRQCEKPACVLRNATHRMFARRCEGFFQGSASAGGKPAAKYVEVGKEGAGQKLRELTEKEKPDCVLLTDAGLLKTWKEAKLGSDASLAVFDLSADTVVSVQDKEAEFLVDQQPFVQGYLPVVLLVAKLQTGLQLVDTWINSGPALDTAQVLSEEHVACLDQGFPLCDPKPLMNAFDVAELAEPWRAPPASPFGPVASGLSCLLLVGGAILAALLLHRRASRRPGTRGPLLAEAVE